jgi:vacuolar-type H+-ATPase subunit H
VNLALLISIITIFILVSFLAFILIKKKTAVRAVFKARQEAKEILDEANQEAEKTRREASLEAK